MWGPGTTPAQGGSAMDSKRAHLKDLAARSARLWGGMPIHGSLAGETRIETRNTVYRLRDGICHRIERDARDQAGRAHPDAFVGMRVVGWLMRDDPRSALMMGWQPGAYAVLWRPRMGPTDRSAVALTSATVAFQRVVRATPTPPSRSGRVSTPPPPPLAAPRFPPLSRPPTPPSIARPSPPSTTRLHQPIPRAPETPTPLVRSVPPPLPPRARAAASLS